MRRTTQRRVGIACPAAKGIRRDRLQQAAASARADRIWNTASDYSSSLGSIPRRSGTGQALPAVGRRTEIDFFFVPLSH
ncbi:protein of unknown function (plasmid) [Caballeronia sp. S22]